MNEPHDPNRTVDEAPSAPADSLDAGLAAGFAAPRSGLSHRQPLPLMEAEGHGVLPSVPGYRVLREIARGGMGRVLAAVDLALDRDVALKVLLPGANAERFVRESKITARMPHPAVPPVYALGTLPDGSPFLAMKLVAGHTLADEMKTADRPRLLQAFTQVCQAVGFAYSRGVVHRDLKPANVMVGAFGEVQVMDWGLAKDLTNRQAPDEPSSPQGPTACLLGASPEQTTDHRSPGEQERTQAGQVMGTPAYMAPEQARGEATDARTDVFALGAVLCAILTGEAPYSGKSTLEVIRRAGAADLTEAMTRLDGCGADAELLRLCRRCLSPKPADRPADGQAVADGLTAYLGGVQERLRQAELAETEGRATAAGEARRRRLTLTLAATVLLAVLGAAAGTGVYLMQAEKARTDKALRDTAERERQGRNAEVVLALLGQTQDALLRDDAARAAVALEAAKRRSAEGGAEEHDQRLKRLKDDLDLVRDLDAIDQLSWTWPENQFPDPAVVARRTRAALRRFGADPEAVPETATVLASVVRERIVLALDRLLLHPKAAGVRALLRRVDSDTFRDAVRDKILANDRAKLVELAGQQAALGQPPGFAAFLGEIVVIPEERRRQLLAAALRRRPGNLGLLMTMGNTYHINRKEAVDEQLRWYQAAVAAAPANPAAHNNLGCALRNKSQVDEAIASSRQAIALNPKLAPAHSGLGTALRDKGQVDKAIASYRKAIALDPNYAAAHNNLGAILCAVKGDYDGAIACFQKAIALDPKLAPAHTGLGNALRGKGKVDKAIASHRKAIALDPNYADARNNLGAILCDVKGNYDGAIACFRQAIALDAKDAKFHLNLGNALRGKGQVEEAIACFRQAIGLNPKLALAHSNLASALYGKGQLDEAIACFQKAIALDPKNSPAHSNLGVALAGKGKVDEAIACFRQAIGLNPKLAKTHYNLGNALSTKGKEDEAIACFRQTIELDPKHAEAHCNLGSVLMRQGQFAESLEAYKRGHALGMKQPGWRNPSAAWVRQAERLATLERKLPAFLKGKLKPSDTVERLDLICVCNARKLHHTTTRLYADAFAAEPKLADDLNAAHRYNAACYAALAAAGQGKDAAGLDDKERVWLRQQALDWLKADLTLRTRQLESGKAADRALVQRALRYWQKDADLAGLRDKEALAKLPANAQKAFAQLWADVATLLKKAETPAKKDSK